MRRFLIFNKTFENDPVHARFCDLISETFLSIVYQILEHSTYKDHILAVYFYLSITTFKKYHKGGTLVLKNKIVTN